MKGFLGIKKGMTLTFDRAGNSVPVTLIQFHNNVVTKKCTKEKDGYDSLQLSVVDKKNNKCNTATVKRYKAAKTSPKYYSKEIRDFKNYEVGDTLNIKELFQEGQLVDVTSYSKGKGFSGAIKRHNQSRGPMSHGSGYHRGSGSMGAITQNRVFKNKKLAGRMGFEKTTVQNLILVKINDKDNYVLVKGSIPGANGSLVIIKQSIKKPNILKKIELFSLSKDLETAESIHEKAKLEHEKEDVIKKQEAEKELEKEKQAVLNKERV